jgi:tRNA-Thr(GGU) m(6)t(6)A37 methyltransferase TsaA
MDSLTLTPIGTLRSPFREKFGIPRQPGLTPHALARLVLDTPYARPECVDGLREFSHLWLVFVFHATAEQGWNPTVRPPRLGGNQRVGVFATRSMFRPNPLGLSLVELVDILDGENGKELLLRGADLLDGTPIVDIKPYLPYVESLPAARGGFAPSAPQPLTVRWSAAAEVAAARLGVDADLHALIGEVMAQDPRPAYAEGSHAPAREYGIWLAQVNVKFTIQAGEVLITTIEAKP